MFHIVLGCRVIVGVAPFGRGVLHVSLSSRVHAIIEDVHVGVETSFIARGLVPLLVELGLYGGVPIHFLLRLRQVSVLWWRLAPSRGSLGLLPVQELLAVMGRRCRSRGWLLIFLHFRGVPFGPGGRRRG